MRDVEAERKKSGDASVKERDAQQKLRDDDLTSYSGPLAGSEAEKVYLT